MSDETTNPLEVAQSAYEEARQAFLNTHDDWEEKSRP